MIDVKNLGRLTATHSPKETEFQQRNINFPEASEMSKAVWEHISQEWDIYTNKLLLYQKL